MNKRFAVLFPGQGSQALGMMADYADNPQVKTTFEQASDALGVDMWAMVNDERLFETQWTQPALLTSSIAIWRVLSDQLPQLPTYLAGHSLGEYSALCASGVIEFDDAVHLVHERGKYMTQAVIGMDTQMVAVLGLADEQVADLCQRACQNTGMVDPANYNSPGQVVIAGTAIGVAKVIEEVQSLGNKCVPLKVSVPSHCQLMMPACERLAELLQQTTFYPPKIDVIQNLTATVANSVEEIKTKLIRQLSEPVLWSATMDKLAKAQMAFVIECGHGNVLSNLAKRQDEPLLALATDKPAKLQKIQEMFDES